MVNNKDFVNKLKEVMKHYHLTASLFADKISVQRSSISHILSGRNKPSLDFVLKIVNTFSDVDLYWLLDGKGNFPKTKGTTYSPTLFSEETEVKIKKEVIEEKLTFEKKIKLIIVFYTDGTFEEYKK